MSDANDVESSEYGDRDESYFGPLQRGEFAAAIGAGAVALVIGLWAGVWAVPDAALAVPSTVERGHTIAAYQPVPKSLPVMSVVVVAIGGYAGWSSLRTTPEQDAATVEGEPADD